MSDPFLGYESRTSESHKSMFVQKVLHMTKAISPNLIQASTVTKNEYENYILQNNLKSTLFVYKILLGTTTMLY
jgi:hypothetical protein